jgi:hypothetical protein
MQENTPDDLEDDEKMKQDLESGFKDIGMPQGHVDLFATDAFGDTPAEENDTGRAD